MQMQEVQMGEVAGVWGVLREEWLILAFFNTHVRHRHRQVSGFGEGHMRHAGGSMWCRLFRAVLAANRAWVLDGAARVARSARKAVQLFWLLQHDEIQNEKCNMKLKVSKPNRSEPPVIHR
jgi:hypothetical protein